jgi:sulfatase maturation enzyme AslB (radical SAM superfamily)
MTIAPLFVKYQTKSGNYFIYDIGTNEIVRIGKTIYDIIDDFRILNNNEIIDKYRSLGENNILEALTKLNELQVLGILCDNGPQLSLRGNQVFCQGKKQSFEDLLRDHRRLLILELTQKCNLRCEYCCYGNHYPELRKHSEETMSLEVAKNAIEDFFAHHPQKCLIGFYGGEPLLEFELLKQLVFFAEDIANQYKVKPEFGINTNGTLLTDDKIHFLVEHAFEVDISLDGYKEMHDKYRVFRNDNHPGQRTGTYDVVMNNLERFFELHPDYANRCISLTLSATSDFNEINNFLRPLKPLFDAVLAGFVRKTSDDFLEEENNSNFRMESWSTFPCDGGSCIKEQYYTDNKNNDAKEMADLSSKNELAEKVQHDQEFCNWTKERKHYYRSCFNSFIEELCQNTDAETIENKYPLFCTLFKKFTKNNHKRVLYKYPPKCHFQYTCFPGAVRTFCSSQGVLYPCEKTETGKIFELGHASTGVDIKRAVQLSELFRSLGDCGNCIARRLCPQCLATISELNNSGRANALVFQQRCKYAINILAAELEEYTTIMEMNQAVIDKLLPYEQSNDWLNDIWLMPTEDQLREIEVGVEELEQFV